MATFDVSQEVDELTFDFTKYVPDAKGTIPEPSNDAITAFRRRIAELLPVAVGEDGKPGVDLSALVEKYGESEDAAKGLEADLYKSVADLCSNTPTVEQIRALPFRGQRAFIGWIIGKFVSTPEASAPATSL